MTDTADGKPDCGRCPHRRLILGEAVRISCGHPVTVAILGGQEAHLAAKTGYTGPIGVGALGVVGDPDAVRSSRFRWPINFDPAALRSCSACPRSPSDLTFDAGAPPRGDHRFRVRF